MRGEILAPMPYSNAEPTRKLTCWKHRELNKNSPIFLENLLDVLHPGYLGRATHEIHQRCAPNLTESNGHASVLVYLSAGDQVHQLARTQRGVPYNSERYSHRPVDGAEPVQLETGGPKLKVRAGVEWFGLSVVGLVRRMINGRRRCGRVQRRW